MSQFIGKDFNITDKYAKNPDNLPRVEKAGFHVSWHDGSAELTTEYASPKNIEPYYRTPDNGPVFVCNDPEDEKEYGKIVEPIMDELYDGFKKLNLNPCKPIIVTVGFPEGYDHSNCIGCCKSDPHTPFYVIHLDENIVRDDNPQRESDIKALLAHEMIHTLPVDDKDLDESLISCKQKFGEGCWGHEYNFQKYAFAVDEALDAGVSNKWLPHKSQAYILAALTTEENGGNHHLKMMGYMDILDYRSFISYADMMSWKGPDKKFSKEELHHISQSVNKKIISHNLIKSLCQLSSAQLEDTCITVDRTIAIFHYALDILSDKMSLIGAFNGKYARAKKNLVKSLDNLINVIEDTNVKNFNDTQKLPKDQSDKIWDAQYEYRQACVECIVSGYQAGLTHPFFDAEATLHKARKEHPDNEFIKNIISPYRMYQAHLEKEKKEELAAKDAPVGMEL